MTTAELPAPGTVVRWTDLAGCPHVGRLASVDGSGIARVVSGCEPKTTTTRIEVEALEAIPSKTGSGAIR